MTLQAELQRIRRPVSPGRFQGVLGALCLAFVGTARAAAVYGPVVTTEAGPQGEFRLNQQPYLPLVITMLENNGIGTLSERLARAAAAGFNTVQISDSPAGLRTKLDLLQQTRLYGRVALFGAVMDELAEDTTQVAALVRALRDHPALLGWELQDELNVDPARYPPERVRAAYRNLRRLDPKHAVWLNLTQFGPDGAASWTRWAGCADVMSNDNYPFTRGGELAAYIAALDWVLRSRPGVAATYLQFSQLHPEVAPPTAAGLRMLAYLALIRGHRAFSYYGYAEGPLETWRDYPLLWDAAKQLNAELPQAFELLLRPETRLAITPSLDGDWPRLFWQAESIEPLQLAARQVDEHTVACFALGLPAYEGQARFTLDPAVTLQSVTSWPDGAPLPVLGNSWSDRFFRGQAGVYLLHY